ncbi:transposase [Streptomyces sp. NPDC008125]|uniref:transposase n=1 Tax=Streptomyces sp. NPDC008125 TaxID=3364811 RepID=UPI0036EB4683
MKAGAADLLWLVRSVAVLPVMETLADGSYPSQIVAARDNRRRADPERVRVIEYALGPRDGDGTVHRLITILLGPEQAPAEELAALHAQRWEIENTLDQTKNHQGVPGLVLRSRSPRGVEQEVFAFLLVHHALRDLMHRAALKAGHDPDRVSFTRTLRVVRRHVTGQAALSPSWLTRSLTQSLREVIERLLPARRLRSNPRVIKRKMSNWALKRAEHYSAPPPNTPAVRLVDPTRATPTSRKAT